MRRWLTGMIAVSVSLLLIISGSAFAVSQTVSDQRGDAPPRNDILRATYRNGVARLATRLVIDDVKSHGKARLVISDKHRVVDYIATVKRHANGNLERHLRVREGSLPSAPVRCHVRASWKPAKDIVAISVRHRCVHLKKRLFLRAAAGGAGRSVDWAPSVGLLRG